LGVSGVKIDTRILKTREGNYVWEDDNPSGHGFLVNSVGDDVPDKWLEENGLVEPEKPAEPEPKEDAKAPATKPIAAKQTPPSANKMQGPKSNK
jgi:hypothetical protein